MKSKLTILGWILLLLTLVVPIYYASGGFLSFEIIGAFEFLISGIVVVNIIQAFGTLDGTVFASLIYTIASVIAIIILIFKLLHRKTTILKIIVLISGVTYAIIKATTDFHNLRIGFILFCLGILTLLVSNFLNHDDKQTEK